MNIIEEINNKDNGLISPTKQDQENEELLFVDEIPNKPVKINEPTTENKKEYMTKKRKKDKDNKDENYNPFYDKKGKKNKAGVFKAKDRKFDNQMPNFDYNFNKMAYINFFNSKEQRTLVKLVEKEGFLKVYNSVGKTTFNRNIPLERNMDDVLCNLGLLKTSLILFQIYFQKSFFSKNQNNNVINSSDVLIDIDEDNNNIYI